MLNHTVTQHKLKERKFKDKKEGKEGLENMGDYNELEEDD